MEYTQWAVGFASLAAFIIVLILVVMEYTQWDGKETSYWEVGVLILVVMEYTQWVIARNGCATSLRS